MAKSKKKKSKASKRSKKPTTALSPAVTEDNEEDQGAQVEDTSEVGSGNEVEPSEVQRLRAELAEEIEAHLHMEGQMYWKESLTYLARRLYVLLLVDGDSCLVSTGESCASFDSSNALQFRDTIITQDKCIGAAITHSVETLMAGLFKETSQQLQNPTT